MVERQALKYRATAQVTGGRSMESPEHQKRLVRNFLQLKDPDDTVVHLEKVASEGIFGRHHDVWDVHTDRGRW
jgi:hypothetical protein